MKTTLPTGHELEALTCRLCDVKTVSNSAWRRFTKDERRLLLDSGYRQRGTGLYMCVACTVRKRRNGGSEVFSNFDIALTGGTWVRQGLIKKWVPFSDSPTTPRPAPKPLPARKARPNAPISCECGFLLAAQNENCPACFAWAVRDSIQHSWRKAA